MSLTSAIERIPDEIEPARAATIMLWLIAGFTAAMLAWAALAYIDEVAIAQGKVIPTRQLQVVSNLEGGIVKDILVRPGERVVAGQVLLRLDNTLSTADFGKTNESQNALVARAARLQAEVSGGTPVFPASLVAGAPDVVATERALFSARRADLASESAGEAAKLEQAQRALGQAEVEAQTRGQAQALAERELAMVAPLVDKGIEPQIALLRAQSAAAQAKGAREGAELAVRRAGSAISEARARLRGVVERFRAQSVEALTQVRSDLAAQGSTLPALADKLTRTELRAPIAGTVNRVLVTTIGGTVRPGEPLIELVPRGDELVVEAAVRPADIAFVHLGQKAFVKLSAYDYSVYGGLDGVVERISPDASVDQKTGESHFTIRVRTDQTGLTAPDGTPLPIGVGMQAEVDVLGNKRSVLSYLLTPVNKLRDNAFREK